MVTKALQSFSQHILIASTKITANKRLLSELENRHNVVLLERDYFAFYNAMHNSPFHLQPDLLVDERTCIILRALPDLQTNKKCKGFTEALISAQLKCSTCFVIMVQLEPTSDRLVEMICCVICC